MQLDVADCSHAKELSLSVSPANPLHLGMCEQTLCYIDDPFLYMVSQPVDIDPVTRPKSVAAFP